MTDRIESHSAIVDGTNDRARGPSRRGPLLAGRAGAVRVALAGAPGAAARLGDRDDGGTNVTVEVLTTIVTTGAVQSLSLSQAAGDTVGATSREGVDHHIVLFCERESRIHSSCAD